MENSSLKQIDGKKIRRQYFNAPLIFIYSFMIFILYAIFVISSATGKFDATTWSSELRISIWLCFVISLPFIILRILCKHFFGSIICVLNEEGIYYANNRKLYWKTIRKIEYAIDSKPRYKSDVGKSFRAIIYTNGGKIVTLKKTPVCFLRSVKKLHKELEVKVLGLSSLLPTALVIASIIFLPPLYIVSILNSPGGVSSTHFIVLAIICIVLGLVRIPVFDAYSIPYRFWRRILPKKWLSYILLGFYYPSYFIALVVLLYFPNWVVVSILGIYLGLVQPPFPSRHGSGRFNRIRSYQELYDIYITNADLWKKKIAKKAR